MLNPHWQLCKYGPHLSDNIWQKAKATLLEVTSATRLDQALITAMPQANYLYQTSLQLLLKYEQYNTLLFAFFVNNKYPLLKGSTINHLGPGAKCKPKTIAPTHRHKWVENVWGKIKPHLGKPAPMMLPPRWLRTFATIRLLILPTTRIQCNCVCSSVLVNNL